MAATELIPGQGCRLPGGGVALVTRVGSGVVYYLWKDGSSGKRLPHELTPAPRPEWADNHPLFASMPDPGDGNEWVRMRSDMREQLMRPRVVWVRGYLGSDDVTWTWSAEAFGSLAHFRWNRRTMRWFCRMFGHRPVSTGLSLPRKFVCRTCRKAL